MESVYNIDINNEVVYSSLERMTSQTFKLLPMREEDKDWEKPLETLSLELLGLSNFFPEVPCLFSAACKLEGIKELGEKIDFMSFRRTIFEVCGLLTKAKDNFS